MRVCVGVEHPHFRGRIRLLLLLLFPLLSFELLLGHLVIVLDQFGAGCGWDYRLAHISATVLSLGCGACGLVGNHAVRVERSLRRSLLLLGWLMMIWQVGRRQGLGAGERGQWVEAAWALKTGSGWLRCASL